MTKRTKNHKLCGTCEFWTGPRDIDHYQLNAEYDGNAEGKCMGQWKHMTKEGHDYCNGWKAWSLFK
ncbi:MAG TPA: hypothetical protein PLD73_05655 [Candidatus Hydrogenedentes bacterium]|jgi:hypothetical protein|nr:hypothetical protein [Candidatus Hydrogenedentota bacterium]HOS77691.1 hypothetical protein [Syntrophales bacterium]